MKMIQRSGRLLVVAASFCVLCAASAPALTFDEWLNELNGADGWEKKAKVWRKAGELGAAAIPQLAEIIAAAPIQENNDIDAEKKNRAKIAATALDYVAHHATRPGANAERRAVNAELVKLIGREKPEVVRIKALEILASTGDDASVSAIAAVMRDPDPKMRERGRWALDRIPGRASVRALEAAIPGASSQFRRDLILTLGDKKAASAVPLLMREAESSDPAIGKAAVEALARIGDRRGIKTVEAAFKTWTGADRAAATDSYLLMAENTAAGSPESAARIYRTVLKSARNDAARCAALVGIGKTGGGGTFGILIDSLGDPSGRVRGSASNALIEMDGADVDQRLLAAARSSKPAVKSMLLRVVAMRDEKAPATQALLKDAARDPNAEVRVTALELLGGLDDPGLEATLLEAAEKGSAQIRPVALRSYVRLADTRLGDGKQDEALAMYHRVLDLTDSDDIRRNALEGVRVIASLESLERVEKLLEGGSGVEINAALAYVAIVAKMGETDRDDAVQRLEDLIGRTRSPGVATAAIVQLRKWGIDTAGFAAKAGFVTRWWVAGPFPFGGENGFDQSFFDEADVDVKKPVKVADKSYEWKEFRTDDAQGKVRLHPVLRPNNNVAAYAYAEIDSPRERDVMLLIGSDDGNIVWLNGEKTHANNATRGIQVDQDKVKAKLRQGPNRLLVKITQGGGEWEFCVRIGNPQGRPIDITRWGMGGTR